MFVNIEAERARKLLTKDELCTALGISLTTYKRYISGNWPIPSGVLLSMSQLFDCSIDYLLGLTDNRQIIH